MNDPEWLIIARIEERQRPKRDVLVAAIRRFTVEMPNDQPHGKVAQQLLVVERLMSQLGRGRWETEMADALAKLCSALADDTQALREAAEAFFGGDFRKPQQ